MTKMGWVAMVGMALSQTMNIEILLDICGMEMEFGVKGRYKGHTKRTVSAR